MKYTFAGMIPETQVDLLPTSHSLIHLLFTKVFVEYILYPNHCGKCDFLFSLRLYKRGDKHNYNIGSMK